MPLLQPTKDLLGFLRKNPGIRDRIKAPHGKTLLYAGNFFQPVWKELAQLKQGNPSLADKDMLPDVLGKIRLAGQPFPTLLDWVKSIDPLQPWKENGFIAWRAVSGIFAANASGPVSFYIGSNILKGTKVFAATEMAVLLRNLQVDATTKDILAYYQRCITAGQTQVNFGFIAG